MLAPVNFTAVPVRAGSTLMKQIVLTSLILSIWIPLVINIYTKLCYPSIYISCLLITTSILESSVTISIYCML